MSIEQHKAGSDEQAPAGLAADLRRMYRAPAGLDARIDDAILTMARERAAAGASRRMAVRRLTRWGLVAAAGLAVGVSLTVKLGWLGPSHAVVVARAAEDVNGDGVVDILDALALERAVESHGAAKQWDLNGDGTVDKADVDRIAMAAVRLTPKAGGHG
jgi:hypothetical protein